MMEHDISDDGLGDPVFLLNCSTTKMPFGKFSGRYLSDLPEEYLLWFEDKGFPNGKLGKMMAFVLELKKEGCEHLLKTVRKKSEQSDI